MAYLLNKPQATDLLSESQSVIKDNFNTANSVFGVDHYSFADGTGFHNKVTTPLIQGSAHPTTVADPIMYSMEDSANIGVIQYSRGPNDAAPTPLTSLHSSSVASSITSGSGLTILDLSGVTQLLGSVYAMNYSAALIGNTLMTSQFYYNSLVPTLQAITRISTATGMDLIINGTQLRLKNNTNSTLHNVFWTIVIHRINT